MKLEQYKWILKVIKVAQLQQQQLIKKILNLKILALLIMTVPAITKESVWKWNQELQDVIVILNTKDI